MSATIWTVPYGMRRHREMHPPKPCVRCGIPTLSVETTYAERLHRGGCTRFWDNAYSAAGITRGPWRPMSLIGYDPSTAGGSSDG